LNFTVQDPNGNITATWVDWGDGSNPDLIFNMTSTSMCQAPGTDLCSIAPGDLLFAKPENPSSIVNGSIIIFRPYLSNPDFLVAHRVVWIFPPNNTSNQYVFWTKGDANSAVDLWNATAGTPAKQVAAVYEYTILPLGSPIDRTDTHAYHVLGGFPSRGFTVTVNATDYNGLQAQFTTTETIKDVPPTVGITGASPNPLIAGSKISLGFIATDPDGTVSTLTINWGDGTIPQNVPANTPFETHLYNNPGAYTISIQATDDAGLMSTATTTTITVKAQPLGSAPTTVLGLEPLIFYGTIASVTVALGTAAFLVIRKRKTFLRFGAVLV
jgi:PKD domain